MVALGLPLNVTVNTILTDGSVARPTERVTAPVTAREEEPALSETPAVRVVRRVLRAILIMKEA